MQGKDFLYFLLNEMGGSYHTDNGAAEVSVTPDPLMHAPDGWQETSINWQRNSRYKSHFRSFTNPYKFVKDAAKIIRTRLYNYGTEDKIYLLILWLDKTFTGGWVHRTFYKGELDLSQAEDELTSVTVPISEGDLVKLFKANEDTVYEIPITGPIVKDDGILLFETGNFRILDDVALDFSDTGHGNLQYVTVPLIVIGTEGTSSGITFLGQDVGADVTTHFIEASADNGAAISVRLKGSKSFTCNANSRSNVQIILRHIVGGLFVTADEIILRDFNPVLAGSTYSFDFDVTISLLANEEWVMAAYMPGVGPAKITFLSGTFSATFSNRFTTTWTPTMRPEAMGQALLDKITGVPNQYVFDSKLFHSTWENLVITSGDAIRGLPNPVIKTSWQKFFDSYNVPCNISMAIKPTYISVESGDMAYSPVVVADLGEVSDLVVKRDQDSLYNSLEIGYPDLDTHSYESLNAKEEFNVTSSFTSKVTRVNKKLSLVSAFKSSMYEQELKRINLDGKNTTADAGDDDVYFKLIEKTPTAGTGAEPPVYYNYLRSGYDSITGLLDPNSAYNIGISPMNCLLRHGSELRQYFYGQEMKKLVYQTSDQSPTLVTVKGGVTIDERDSPVIGSLAAPQCLPVLFETKSPMARNIKDVMTDTPTGTFSFEWMGDTYYGYANSISVQPANRPVQNSTLQCSAATDLTKLIH
jgi:hypothetical protein